MALDVRMETFSCLHCCSACDLLHLAILAHLPACNLLQLHFSTDAQPVPAMQPALPTLHSLTETVHNCPCRLATLYPRNLLVAAVQSRPFIAKLEQAFAAFMADRDHQRHALAPMPHKERALVHQLASLYNFTSCSFKQEPARYVSLFKTAASGQPEMCGDQPVHVFGLGSEIGLLPAGPRPCDKCCPYACRGIMQLNGLPGTSALCGSSPRGLV